MYDVAMSIVVVLHNIRSAHNVGSVFRTADGALVSTIILSGYTPTPTDRFGRIREDIRKTSLGATETIPYEKIDDLRQYLQTVRASGFTVVAVEQTKNSVPYTALPVPEHVVYIFGNEITGIEDEILACAHHCIQIPMRGKKESLNVSVCAGIILFHAQEHTP